MQSPFRDAPKSLNIFRIRFPIGAIASIGHRISGVLLLFGLPVLALVLDRSLASEAAFESQREAVDTPWSGGAAARPDMGRRASRARRRAQAGHEYRH
ncbi:succinate dehydrogenase, cytochrome b556 subunit [Methyloversatilis sp. XJ19-49]|nr:succinate dehydrogenase, cytochrome b556 subunit [Methyloversatilis sp. XJ19-49]